MRSTLLELMLVFFICFNKWARGAAKAAIASALATKYRLAALGLFYTCTASSSCPLHCMSSSTPIFGFRSASKYVPNRTKSTTCSAPTLFAK